jgi:hypothetical protein
MAVGVGNATAGSRPSVTGAAKFADVVPGADAQVRINAHGDPARGNFSVEQGAPLGSISGTVTCITVVGNQASVGGVIEESSDPSDVGQGFIQFVEDNGSPGQGDFSETVWPVTPPGATCPAPIHPEFQVNQGNYVVMG